MNNLRINPKVYGIAENATPLEVQEFDGRKIEIFNMNDYTAVKDEFINKGKFAVWSSIDGVNYRVFIEEGYYSELKALYSEPVNKIWVDFWDTCEKISRKTTLRVVLPITAVAIAGCFLSALIPGNAATYVMIGIVVVAFVAMMFFNRLTKKKIYEANVSSVEAIKQHVGGEAGFNKLLDTQKNYMDSYYAALYPEEEEEDQMEEGEISEPNQEAIEAPEVEVIEETDSLENIEVEEKK